MTKPNTLPRRRRIKQAGIRFLSLLAPFVYLSYMGLVRMTSRRSTPGLDTLRECNSTGNGALIALLHQDLLIAPSMLRGLDLATLVNIGDAGNILTRILEKMGYIVLRGGSSTSPTRRTGVIKEITELTARPEHAGMVTALTPDGSRGPAGGCKPGIAWLAFKAGLPVYCTRVHARRAWYLPTWDRTSLPTPFNSLSVEVIGPISPPATATREEMERCRAEIETGLHELHARSFERDGKEPVPELAKLPAKLPRKRAAVRVKQQAGVSARTPPITA